MDVSFEEYRRWVQKYDNNHDTREINYQNDVVKRLLEKLYPEYDVVDVSIKGRGSKNHDYFAYSGGYIDSKGIKKPTTPDLLVCKYWDWYNVGRDDIIYLATIEVKSPYSREAVYRKHFEDYTEFRRTKIERHLSAKKVHKVILTDALKWEFYDKTLDSRKPIVLANYNQGRIYEWKEDADSEFQTLKNELQTFLEG